MRFSGEATCIVDFKLQVWSISTTSTHAKSVGKPWVGMHTISTSAIDKRRSEIKKKGKMWTSGSYIPSNYACFQDQRLMVVIKAHEGSVNDLKFDVSNDWFASCGSDNLIKVWSFPNPELLLTYTGHKLSVRALEISTQLAYMFSGSEDKNIICWDLETNKPIRNYHGHLSGVYSLALHPSIPYLIASGSRDSSVRVWDVRTRLPIYVLNHDGPVNCLQFQNDEPQLVSGSQDRTVKFWDLKTGKSTNTITTMQNSVRCLALSELEYTFVAGAKTISQFAFPNGELLGEFGQDEVLNTMSIVNNSVYTGYDSGKLINYDYTSGDVVKETLTKSSIMSSCVDMSHTILVTGHLDSTIKLWELDEE